MNKKMVQISQDELNKLLAKARTEQPEKPINEWDEGRNKLDALLVHELGNEIMDRLTRAYQVAKDSGISTGYDAKGNPYKVGAKLFGDVFKVRAYVLASEAATREAALTVEPTPTGNKITVREDGKAKRKVKSPTTEAAKEVATGAFDYEAMAKAMAPVIKATVQAELADLTAPMDDRTRNL